MTAQLQAQIREKREAAGRAIEQARGFAAQMREKPAEAATLQEKFDAAHAEGMKSLKEAQGLQAQLDVEQAHEYLNQPVPFQHQGGDGPEGQRHGPVREEFKAAHREAFEVMVRNGELEARSYVHQHKVLSPSEKHALLTKDAELGGFLAPDDFRAEVVRALPGFAPLMAVVRVIPTSRSTLVLPTIVAGTDPYPTGFAGAWKAEGATTGGTAPTVQNQPKFGQERIPVHRWEPDAVELTQELIEDTEAPLEGILAEIIAETLGLDLDDVIIDGSGVGRPEGIQTAAPTAVNSGNGSALTYGGLVDLYAKLPAQYRQNARFLMASDTYGRILKLESTGGFSLFPPNSLPGTLFTKPILFSEQIEAVAANKFPIIFGDFRYYVVAQRRDLRIQRLVERFAPNIGILPVARIGGQVVQTAAFRRQKISA